MKVAISQYLTARKPLLKELVARLSRRFGYVSVLGTDTTGKNFSVQKTGISVTDSIWTERGFVVRVHNGMNYAEYSFNELNEETLDALVEDITMKLQDPRSMLPSLVNIGRYPVIEEEPVEKSFRGKVKILPGEVSSEQKLKRMAGMMNNALSLSPLLVDVRVRYEEVHLSKIFLSEKKDLEQSYIWSQGYVFAIARRDKNTRYSYRGFSGLKGVELLAEMEEAYGRVVSAAEKLLDAEPVDPGVYEVICSPEIAGLIAHEAFGHGVEMDMFVKKRAKALEYLGKPVASELVTMHDGAAAAGHVSSYLFDDEGVLASDTVIIDKGELKTGISDLLSALKLGTKPTGNGKRESFERKAYARMTNTFFAPGKDRLEEMIASIKHGYLLDGTMSGMEDPKNWGIQCLILRGEEIIDGKLTGKIVSPVIMTGYVPDLLKAISMVSGDLEFFGTGYCGKGHKERVKVSDGGPYIKTKARLG